MALGEWSFAIPDVDGNVDARAGERSVDHLLHSRPLLEREKRGGVTTKNESEGQKKEEKAYSQAVESGGDEGHGKVAHAVFDAEVPQSLDGGPHVLVRRLHPVPALRHLSSGAHAHTQHDTTRHDITNATTRSTSSCQLTCGANRNV
jgi:hypothetical protein